MKTGLIIVLLICCSMLACIMPAPLVQLQKNVSIQAERTIDENIDLLYNSGDFYTCIGSTFFVADYLKDNVNPDISEAMQYLAEAGYLFAVIQGDLEAYKYTDDIKYMKYVDYIGCPYKDQDATGIVYISAFYFKEAFDHLYLPSISMEDRLQISKDIVTKGSGTMTFDYWNEH